MDAPRSQARLSPPMLYSQDIPQTHPLFLPELLDLVSGLLDTSDWLALMRTCRPMFPVIASRVWREIEAQVIMDLIVETSRTDVTSSDDSNHVVGRVRGLCIDIQADPVVFQLNLQAEPAFGLTRFDIYAPFVRQLRVYGRTARYFKGERRRICTRRAEEGMLLPSVTSVTLLTSDLDTDSAAVFWLDLFLMPSLRELNVKPATKTSTAWVSYSVASKILGQLTTTCSDIERLEFYPKEITRDGGERGVYDVASRLALFSPRDFCSCTQLRRVTSSISILSDGGLSALSGLPRLYYLSLHGCGEQLKSLQLSAPDGSFSSLTHLSLLDMNAVTLAAIMGVKPLSRGLTSLRIGQIFEGSIRHHNELCGQQLDQTFPCLLEHTTHLKSLSYDVTHTSSKLYHGQFFVYTIEPLPFLQLMSRSPLQQVSLLGLRFNWRCEWFKLIPMAFPRVTSFRMPHQNINSAGLPWLVELPYLRHLVLSEVSLSLPFPGSSGVSGPLETLDATISLATNYYTGTSVISAEQGAR
ncbi:hypothetical protein FRC12_002446 [Ceratobasidium sp. 428]|nr:hypothetical protein FRC12_002446 [Ceratobasidium sp. 428]